MVFWVKDGAAFAHFSRCFSDIDLSLDRDRRAWARTALRQNGLHTTQQAIIWLEGGII